MTNRKMVVFSSRQKVVIIQLLIIMMLVCVGIYLSSESGKGNNVYADGETYTYDIKSLDSPDYEGSTYHFHSELSIAFRNDNGLLLNDKGATYYSNATQVTITWQEVGTNNFVSWHNMSISGDLKLKNISNHLNNYADDDVLDSLADELNFELPKNATNFSTLSKTLNLNEGNTYYLYWSIKFESFGTKELAVGGKQIVIDRTAPTGTLSVENNAYTNSDVTFTWNSNTDLTGASATLDGNKYNSGDTISEEKPHTIVLSDQTGNSNTYKFTIDKTNPTISSSISNAEHTKNQVTVNASDTNFRTLYYQSPNSSWHSTSEKSFTISATNGLWKFYAVDAAGNRSSDFSFTFDNVAPEIGLRSTDEKAFADGAWVNQGVYWDIKETNKKSEILYEQKNGRWEEKESKYQSGTVYYDKRYPDILYGSRDVALSAIIQEENTRKTSKSDWKTITNDKRIIAPGQIDYALEKASYWEYAVSEDEIYVFFVHSDADKFIKSRAQSYLSSSNKNTFMEEGYFKISVEDFAGNKTEKTFHIKLSAPKIEIEPSGYTKEIRYKVTDEFSELTTYVKIDNGKWVEQSSSDLTFGFGDQDGTYYFRTVDAAGNVVTATAVLFTQVIHDFGNLADAYNGYKLNAWYEVTLPQYVFGTNSDHKDIAGKYTFENYDAAYAWCLAVEEEYRVQTRSNGWIYVSATNESISQIYTNREDLEKVMNKYVTRYINGRKILSSSGNDNYYVIKDENGRSDEYAFIRQDIRLPGFLSDYANLDVLQISSKYVFKRLETAVAPTTVSFTYIADDYSLQTKQAIMIPYGKSIKSVLEANEMYKQGYYIVNESDECGNSQSYLVYIDLEAPKIRAEVEVGDGTKKELLFDSDYAEDNAGTFYYISFKIESILDNVDSYNAIKIEGRGLTSAIYAQGDELPVLDAALGGGQYTITVYDRSGNIFQFKLNIANKAPTMEYNSLRATNRQLTLYFATNDNLNQIVRLEIYKINGSGESIKIERDDLGRDIDFTTLEYNFTTGGKFFAVITDRYGRVIETDPIFYERGLPYGELTTSSNSITNKDVYFTYTVGNGVVVYVYDENDNLVLYTDYLLEYDNLNKIYSLGFLASEGLERQYLIHLYNEADDNLYMEYNFGIDTVIAEVKIKDFNGADVEKDGYTNQAFTLNWTESNVRVKYTVGSSSMTATYSRGDLLNGNGLYTFTVSDRVGNTETFTVYLDNIVDYTLEGGKIVNVGGKYLTNSPVSLTINEMISEWKVADGKDIVNGVPITQEGVYVITVSDRYGNTVVVTIELDLTAPEMALQGVESDGSTKGSVVVTFEEGAKCYIMRGNTVVREIRSGETFDEHGSYSLRAEDLAGNTVYKKFNIDRRVDYESNVINRQITTEIVAFALSEEGNVEVVRDGQAVDVANKYSESGKYVLTATDNVGNALVFTFTILPKNAQEVSIELDTQQILTSSKYNGENVKLDFVDDTKKKIELNETGRWVLTISDIEQNQSYTVYLNIDNVAPSLDLIWSKNTVSFSRLNKDGVTAKLFKDGEETKWSQSLVIKDPGHYVLELSDEFGNVNIIEWDLKYRPNMLSVMLIVFGCMAVVGVVILILVKRFRVKVS